MSLGMELGEGMLVCNICYLEAVFASASPQRVLGWMFVNREDRWVTKAHEIYKTKNTVRGG